MSNRKRVLLLTRPICPPWDEASKNFAYTLANNIENAEIHLLTCGKIENLPKNIIQENIFPSPKLDIGNKYRLYKFLRRVEKIDIIHSLFTPTKINSFFIRRALHDKKAKIIQTVATLREDLYGEDCFKRILFGDLIVTYSDYAKEKLEKIGLKNVQRIYPGIDLSEYYPREKNQELMKKYNISQDDFVINFTGEYVRLDAIDDVVESFIDLAKENRNFHLQLACRIKNQKDSDKKKKVIERLREAGCLEKVSFLDDQNYKMSDVYNLSDVSVFPVRSMAGKFDIPLAVIEAMACGVPMISSNIERLRYFLNDENSILIRPGDRESLKEKILELYNNPEKRLELGCAGKKYAIDNFDIIEIVKKYENIYSETII
jgi:glycosyltransferase involved in cell wall biosynthesis